MMRCLLVVLIVLFHFESSRDLHAAELRVEPVLVEVIAPGATATLKMRNEGDAAVTIQIRVFQWSQQDGRDHLVPTRDVVASPPAVTLPPQETYIARIVRVAPAPIGHEESYRLLIDELPRATPTSSSGVRVLVRQSIPVFFRPPDVAASEIQWSVRHHDGEPVLVAENDGNKRIRLSALAVEVGASGPITLREGLAGYVLGKSYRTWPLGQALGTHLGGDLISVFAASDEGPIQTTASVAGLPAPPRLRGAQTAD